jgi:ATP-dependent helicase/nuclease subunit A
VPDERFQPPDQALRDRIASDLDRTILVEAAAGTGKTTCLIARMVSLLWEGKCPIDTIAAVTYTRKAAAELRTRFQLCLERAAHDSAGEGRQRLFDALRHVERAFMGTIHSFCARLLRERPVEAGVDPGFVELDDEIDQQLRQVAWREHVATLVATDDPVLPELERLGLKVSPSTHRSGSIAGELDALGLEPAELGPAFLRFAEFLDVDDWPAQVLPLPDLRPCIERLTAYAGEMRAMDQDLPNDPGNDRLIPTCRLIGRMAARLDLTQPGELMEVLEQFRELERRHVVQKNWPGKSKQALAELDRFNDFWREHAEPLLRAWREHRYEPVIRALRPARELYQRLRRERNGLNFQDLLLYSSRLLRDKPDVRRYFRERFTHLLVDEFQDTDPVQAEVMFLISADNIRETNWKRCRPVPGSLFVVGDPKQSIYRFRRADMVTYDKVRSMITEVGGEVVPLSTNFRSVQPVIEWVNACFSSVFPSTADDCDPRHQPLDVGRRDAAEQSFAVQPLVVPDLRTQAATAEHDADSIARTIRRAIDEQWPVPRAESGDGRSAPARPGDFLIIARQKARLSFYARALQRYGLPHSVTGGSVLNEVPELELLHVCLAAVVKSDDPIALVAALRSELFGVSDVALYDFRRLGGTFSYHAEIPQGLQADDAAILLDAFNRLRTFSLWLRRMPAASAIERIAAETGLTARACAHEQGDAHAGSLLKAIELLRAVDGAWTAGEYLDALGRLVKGDEPRDGVAVRPAGEEPVRVMNLHQCKGLEAPVVFLADPSGEWEHDVEVYIDRSGEHPRGFLPIYGPRHRERGPRPILAQPPGWNELAAVEQRFLDSEAKRLLYVAATRAGVKLVISQRDGKNNQKNPWCMFNDYLTGRDRLPDPGTIPERTAGNVSIDTEAWTTEVEAIDDRWRASLRSTYAVKAVKESVISLGPKPHGAGEGGAEWGEVLHALLEAFIKLPKADLRGLALSALERESLSIALVDEVVEVAQRVVASDVWRRARGARRCMAEVPIAVPLAAPAAGDGLPTVLRGVIDLVFEEAAGWVIVDYKSERVGAGDIPALVAYYKPQVEKYAEIWQAVVAQPVAERGLLFTQTGTYITV